LPAVRMNDLKALDVATSSMSDGLLAWIRAWRSASFCWAAAWRFLLGGSLALGLSLGGRGLTLRLLHASRVFLGLRLDRVVGHGQRLAQLGVSRHEVGAPRRVLRAESAGSL
jgi:hypothetical protein